MTHAIGRAARRRAPLPFSRFLEVMHGTGRAGDQQYRPVRTRFTTVEIGGRANRESWEVWPSPAPAWQLLCDRRAAPGLEAPAIRAGHGALGFQVSNFGSRWLPACPLPCGGLATTLASKSIPLPVCWWSFELSRPDPACSCANPRGWLLPKLGTYGRWLSAA